MDLAQDCVLHLEHHVLGEMCHAFRDDVLMHYLKCGDRPDKALWRYTLLYEQMLLSNLLD